MWESVNNNWTLTNLFSKCGHTCPGGVDFYYLLGLVDRSKNLALVGRGDHRDSQILRTSSLGVPFRVLSTQLANEA